ncbi:hypothetical protein [Parapedobacter composti]|nr:hypothetical protein [Parapedobacter composti]
MKQQQIPSFYYSTDLTKQTKPDKKGIVLVAGSGLDASQFSNL